MEAGSRFLFEHRVVLCFILLNGSLKDTFSLIAPESLHKVPYDEEVPYDEHSQLKTIVKILLLMVCQSFIRIVK